MEVLQQRGRDVLAADPGDGVESSVGGPVGQVVERGLAEEPEEAMAALRGAEQMLRAGKIDVVQFE